MANDGIRSRTDAANEAMFRALARREVVRDLIESVHQATGLAVRLVPPAPLRSSDHLKSPENPFCKVHRQSGAAQNGHCAALAKLLLCATQTRAPQRLSCVARLTHLAVPIIVSNRHVATLIAGPVRVAQSHQRSFAQVQRVLVQCQAQAGLPRLQKLWLATPELPQKQLDGAVRLLEAFVRLIVECAGHWMLAVDCAEPLAVQCAKKFIKAHIGEPLTLRVVAEHVHLSRFHFCKLFKKTTGLTLTQYVWRVRVERAKEFLLNDGHPIKQIASECGFQSVSDFDHIFHELTGFTPTACRGNIGQQNDN